MVVLHFDSIVFNYFLDIEFFPFAIPKFEWADVTEKLISDKFYTCYFFEFLVKIF